MARFRSLLSSAEKLPVVFAAIVAIKLGLLLFDPTVRLFFGDSASYIHSALTGWVPADRSYLYGQLFGLTALATHSMVTLALVQSLFGAISATLLYQILRNNFAASGLLAAVFAILFAIGPAQLFYERMVMAESTGSFFLVAMFAAGFAYLRHPHWLWPIVWATAGILAVSMRLSDLPVVLGFAILPILACAANRATRLRPVRIAAHLLIVIVATSVLHHAYQYWYGQISETRPDYIADSGYFRLGLVAPLVTQQEVLRAGLPADLLEHVGPDLHDPTTREEQIWLGDGLIALVRKAAHGNGRTVARKLSNYAVRGDPFGIVRMGWSTMLGYFDSQVVEARIASDVGRLPADADLSAKLRQCCAYDASVLTRSLNPVARYFAASTGWLTACYFGLLPLALVVLVMQWRTARCAALLLAATSAGMAASLTLFSHIVSFRYLHPFPFMVLLGMGALTSAFVSRSRHARRNTMPVNGDRAPAAPNRPAGVSHADLV